MTNIKRSKINHLLSALVAVFAAGFLFFPGGQAKAAPVSAIYIDHAKIVSSSQVYVKFLPHGGNLTGADASKWWIDVNDGGVTPLQATGIVSLTPASPGDILLQFPAGSFPTTDKSYDAAHGLFVDANGVTDADFDTNWVYGHADSIAISDGQLPLLNSAEYLDLDSDGTVETVRTTWSENVVIPSVLGSEIADWYFDADVGDFNAVSGGAPQDDTPATTLDMRVIADAGETGSTTAVKIGYTDGDGTHSVQDVAGNAAGLNAKVTAVDSAKPAIYTSTTADSVGPDGTVDKITLVFSETVNIADGNAGDGIPGIAFADGCAAAAADYALGNPYTSLAVTLTGCPAMDTDITATPTYHAELGDIKDVSAATNEMADHETVVGFDGAAPVYWWSATLDNNNDGTVDYIKVVYSEPIDDSTVSAADFEAGILNTNAGNLTESFTSEVPAEWEEPGDEIANEFDTANDEVIYIGVASSGETIPVGDTTPTLLIQQVGSIDDFAEPPAPADNTLGPWGGSQTSVDGAAPAPTYAGFFDNDGDGTVDYVRIEFSEAINVGTFVHDSAAWSFPENTALNLTVTGWKGWFAADTMELNVSADADETGALPLPTFVYDPSGTGSVIDDGVASPPPIPSPNVQIGPTPVQSIFDFTEPVPLGVYQVGTYKLRIHWTEPVVNNADVPGGALRLKNYNLSGTATNPTAAVIHAGTPDIVDLTFADPVVLGVDELDIANVEDYGRTGVNTDGTDGENDMAAVTNLPIWLSPTVSGLEIERNSTPNQYITVTGTATARAGTNVTAARYCIVKPDGSTLLGCSDLSDVSTWTDMSAADYVPAVDPGFGDDQTEAFGLEGINIISVPEGIITVHVAAESDEGVFGPDDMVTYYLDMTAPAGLAITTAPVTVNSDDITIAGTMTADPDYVTVTVYNVTDGIAVGSVELFPTVTNWSVVVHLPQDQATAFWASATDASGNIAPASGTVVITEDSTAPSMTISPAVTPDVTTAVITWSTDERATSRVQYGLSADYGNLTADDFITDHNNAGDLGQHRVTLTGLTCNTTYHYSVFSGDAAGNRVYSTDSTFTTLACDGAAPPIPSITTTGGVTVNADAYVIAGTAGADTPNDSVRTIKVYNGTTLVGTVAVPVGQTVWAVTVPLNQGTSGSVANVFKATSTDSFGNTSADSATVTINENSTGPTLRVTYPGAGATLAYVTTVNAVFENNNSDSGTAKYSVNGADWVAATTDLTANSVPVVAGTNTLQVRSTKTVGGITIYGYSPVLTFTVQPPSDTTAPPVPVITTGAAAVNADAYVIAGTVGADTPVATERTVKVYNGANLCATATVPVTTTDWAVTCALTQNAANVFTATSTDVYGNASVASASVTITESSTGPTLLVTYPTAGLSLAYMTTVAATFSASNLDTNSVRYSINGADWAVPSGGDAGGNVAVVVGTNTLQIRATKTRTDGAIIYGYSPVLTFTVQPPDLIPPTPTVSITNITTTGADVIISVDENADRRVRVDTDSAFGSPDFTAAYTGSTAAGPFTVNATGLTANTTYFVQVTVSDQASGAGNVRSVVYAFTTNQLNAPVLVDVLATSNATNPSTRSTITWTTKSDNNGEPGALLNTTTNRVQYGLTQLLGTETAATTGDGVSSHSLLLTDLSAGRIYYYRVKSTANGKTSYSQIFTFTTAPADTGLSIDAIHATRTYATADNTYTNGFAWTFDVTINNPFETAVAMKFAQWVSGANLLNTANNVQYSVDGATWQTITANATYGPNINVLSIDLDQTRGGRQIKLFVQMKVPVGTPGGSYSTSYGVQTQIPD